MRFVSSFHISFLSFSSLPIPYILISLDISGETHVQTIPISSIPSDVLPFSNVASISVDEETSVS